MVDFFLIQLKRKQVAIGTISAWPQLPASNVLSKALALLLTVMLCVSSNAYSKTLTISKITNNPAKHSKKMQPYVDYLVKQLSEYGYTEGKLIFARDPQQLAKYMRSGQVDMASDTPFAYAQTKLGANIEPLAIRWKNGIKEYTSVIFVRADSGILSIDALAGKKIAFEDHSSTSGFALPAFELLEKNLVLEKLYSPRDKTSSAEATAYIFSGSEQTTAAWVLKGLVDAGAVSSLEWYKAQNFLSSGRQDLLAIHTSTPTPRSIEFVRATLEDDVKARLQAVLYEMHTKRDAQKVMTKYQKTSLFQPLNSANIKSLADMEKITKAIMNADL